MPRLLRSPLSAAVLASALTFLVVAGWGIARAAFDPETGAITTCVSNKTGLLRSPEIGHSCRGDETELAWNQAGPEGAQGERGPAGEPGLQGPQGIPGAAEGAGMTCMDEFRVKAALQPFDVRAECGAAPACIDGADNDKDGLKDFPDDSGCSSWEDTSEAPITQCNDGADNDGDGLVDTGDFGCLSPADESEYRGNQCDNGIDDDSDGLIDFGAEGDAGCVDPFDSFEAGGACQDDSRDDADDSTFIEMPLRTPTAGIICPGDWDLVKVEVQPGIDGPSGVTVVFNFDPSDADVQLTLLGPDCRFYGWCGPSLIPYQVISSPTGPDGVTLFISAGTQYFSIGGASAADTGAYTLEFK
ncbi:MAG: collagen-like protein [Dehalococcoidia bacterium]